MKKNIKAVLFDLDGVVVLTDKYHTMGWKRLSQEQGWIFDESFSDRLRGVSRLQSLQIILNHNGLDLEAEEKEALANRKNTYYREYLQAISETDLYPGSLDFIKQLRGYEVGTALCSSSQNASFVLEKLNITRLFDVVVTGNDITHSKPDPEIFQIAARDLRVHPDRCLVFEDAESGIKGAHAAKMRCIGVGEAEILPDAKEVITRYEDVDIEVLLETGHARRDYRALS